MSTYIWLRFSVSHSTIYKWYLARPAISKYIYFKTQVSINFWSGPGVEPGISGAASAPRVVRRGILSSPAGLIVRKVFYLFEWKPAGVSRLEFLGAINSSEAINVRWVVKCCRSTRNSCFVVVCGDSRNVTTPNLPTCPCSYLQRSVKLLRVKIPSLAWNLGL